MVDLILEHLGAGGRDRGVDGVVFEEIAEVAVFAFAHWPVERDWLAADLEYPAGFLDREARGLCGFLDSGFAANFLQQLFGDVAEF